MDTVRVGLARVGLARLGNTRSEGGAGSASDEEPPVTRGSVGRLLSVSAGLRNRFFLHVPQIDLLVATGAGHPVGLGDLPFELGHDGVDG